MHPSGARLKSGVVLRRFGIAKGLTNASGGGRNKPLIRMTEAVRGGRGISAGLKSPTKSVVMTEVMMQREEPRRIKKENQLKISSLWGRDMTLTYDPSSGTLRDIASLSDLPRVTRKTSSLQVHEQKDPAPAWTPSDPQAPLGCWPVGRSLSAL